MPAALPALLAVALIAAGVAQAQVLGPAPLLAGEPSSVPEQAAGMPHGRVRQLLQQGGTSGGGGASGGGGGDAPPRLLLVAPGPGNTSRPNATDIVDSSRAGSSSSSSGGNSSSGSSSRGPFPEHLPGSGQKNASRNGTALVCCCPYDSHAQPYSPERYAGTRCCCGTFDSEWDGGWRERQADVCPRASSPLTLPCPSLPGCRLLRDHQRAEPAVW